MTTVDRAATQGWVADDSTFGARLALIRQRMRWGNVKEAATACGLPTESWRSWERDGRVPQRLVEVASIIADRTGCDLGWLIAGPSLRREQNANVRSGASPGQRTGHHPITRPPRGPGKTTSPVPPQRRRPAPARPPVQTMAR